MPSRLSRKLRFLIASGPTREPLDPVRYLSNYSTGTMGSCLAKAVRRRGHRLSWVRCPEDAQTARDLLKCLRRQLARHDVLVMAAAVCDSRPASFSATKIGKKHLRQIHLVENPDILATLAAIKKKRQVFAGFGIESRDLVAKGARKLRSKNLDLIVLQKVTKKVAPFGDKKIRTIFYDRKGKVVKYGLLDKQKIALKIVDSVERFHSENLA